jgi:hypothetical protein
MESAWLRAQKAVTTEGEANAKLKLAMARTYVNSTIGLLEHKAKETLAALAEGEELDFLLDNLKRLSQYTPRNTVGMRQEIAAAVSAAGKYIA